MPTGRGKILSLLLVEGPTEAIFYGRVKAGFLAACPCVIECVTGLYDVNNKVLQALEARHDPRPVRAYCCLDRESRYAPTPEFDLDFIRGALTERGVSNVLSVDSVIATQMIESWFFHDIAGIYRFLRVPTPQRNLKAFAPVERFGVADLKALFRRHGKMYREGERARHFIESLNIRAIHDACQTLRQAVETILRQSKA